MPYLGYFNSSYVPSLTEQSFIAQPAVHLGPNLLSLTFSCLLQGMLIVQCINYFARWWNTDMTLTKTHVIILLIFSVAQTVAITAQEWALFVTAFGDWEYLTHPSLISRCAAMSSTLLYLGSQVFFVIRIYKLPWRFDYLFIPLVIFFVGILGTSIGQVAMTPTQLGVLPDIVHRLVIGSAVFSSFLSTSVTIILVAFLLYKIIPTSTALSHAVVSLLIQSALPATFLAILALASVFEPEHFAFRKLTRALVGYVQASCVLYSLNSRTHPSSLEAQITAPGREMTADLRWTSRVPLVGTTPRLSLLPLHRRGGSGSAVSDKQTRTDTDVARARRVSEADSGYSISFGRTSVNYNPATFNPIYEEFPENELGM